MPKLEKLMFWKQRKSLGKGPERTTKNSRTLKSEIRRQEEEDDFEEDDMDYDEINKVDLDKIKKMMNTEDDEDEEEASGYTVTIAEKQSRLLINAILSSIYYCVS